MKIIPVLDLLDGIRPESRVVKDAVLLARVIMESAFMREESHGSHYREDYPDLDDKNWKRSIYVRKTDEGELDFTVM